MQYAPKPADSYLDWSKAKGEDGVTVLAADQAKHNLVWLAYPEIDLHGLEFLTKAQVDSINTHMTKDVRSHLLTLPLSFMRFWNKESTKGLLCLAEEMPTDYLTRMNLQAHKAQARLVVREADGVIRATFFKGKAA